MLYIEKEGLTDDINRRIIELRKSEEWKNYIIAMSVKNM